MKILLINLCTEKLHYLEFVKPVEKILLAKGIAFETKFYKKICDKDLSADKIIICGTSLKDNNYLDNLNYFEWIKFYSAPILGICAGMQILSLFFDGALSKNKEAGQIEINFHRKFLGISGNKKVYALHSNAANSDEFEVFAKSGCPQAVKHKFKEIYGVNFHPEVYSKNLIENFCEI